MTESKALIMVESGDRKVYQTIAESKYFKGDKTGLNLATIFCLAVAIGYKSKKFTPLERREYVTRKEYVIKNNYTKNFLYSVAVVHAKNLKVLSDENRIFEIVQSYANGGIKLLYANISDAQSGDYDKQVEAELMNLIK
jgi:hypothetical protein